MNHTVIIVDDSRLSRMSLRAGIARHDPNWQVLEAVDGQTFLELLGSQDVHAALMDVNMPGMTGLEAGTLARRAKPELHLGFITANAQNDIVAAIRSLGGAFLPKPVDEEQLHRFLGATRLPRRP